MKKLICLIFGHKYKLVKNLSYNCQKIKCKRCDKMFSINHNMKTILDWDYELEQLHK